MAFLKDHHLIRSEKFFGRRKGRRLSKRSQEEYDLFSKRYVLDYDSLKTFNAHWLEIGFGCGEHLIQQALHFPDKNILGAEVFENGILNCLRGLDAHRINSVKVWRDDVRMLLPTIPKKTLESVFMLFPDPWRKKRHHKRRLLSFDFLKKLHPLMKNGAQIRVASDHDGYVEWIQDVFAKQSLFEAQCNLIDPPLKRPQGWFPTRYESKAIAAGRSCRYFTLKCKS